MATSFYQVKNNAKSTITNNPLSAGGLSITLASSTGSRFPTTGNTWLATIWDATTYPDPADDPNMEVVLIDSRSTDTLTVNASGRGYAGTTGVSHATGSAIRLLVMKEHIDQITTAVNTVENKVVQVQTGTYTTYAAVTTVIPYDDTIPQNTEGDLLISVSITPKSATNRLFITAGGPASGTAGSPNTTALFQDSTANALAATTTTAPTTDYLYNVVLQHEMAAGTTSATTFKLRVGPNTAGQFNINGNAGSRKLGGVGVWRLTVMEMSA